VLLKEATSTSTLSIARRAVAEPADSALSPTADFAMERRTRSARAARFALHRVPRHLVDRCAERHTKTADKAAEKSVAKARAKAAEARAEAEAARASATRPHVSTHMLADPRIAAAVQATRLGGTARGGRPSTVDRRGLDERALAWQVVVSRLSALHGRCTARRHAHGHWALRWRRVWRVWRRTMHVATATLCALGVLYACLYALCTRCPRVSCVQVEHILDSNTSALAPSVTVRDVPALTSCSRAARLHDPFLRSQTYIRSRYQYVSRRFNKLQLERGGRGTTLATIISLCVY
jgi:hypothetical protein